MKGSTLIALVALVVIGLSALVASNFLKQKFTFLPRAQTSTTWSLDAWDEAANRCPDKGSGLGPCICTQLQSDGICAPVGSTNAKGLICIRNKWDTSWGCWGSPSSANVPGAPDSSSAPGDSCGLTRSQYGTCPDWASENSCHRRLDPPGDPDYGKWFKCVNRWWNGPCNSKAVCEGSVAVPPAEAPAVDTSTAAPANNGGLAIRNGNCFNYDNCKDKCVLNAQNRGEDDADEWYCSDNIKGTNVNNVTGQYCCYPGVSGEVSLTPTLPPRKLGGNCISYNPGDPGCDAPLICKDSICVESTAGTSPIPVLSPTPTPNPAVIAGNEEGKCFVQNAIIKVRTETFTENRLGEASCGSNILLGQSGNYTVYRTCQDMSGNTKPCKYACFVYDPLTRVTKTVICSQVNNEKWTNTVRIKNDTTYNLTIDSLLITKHQPIQNGYYPPPLPDTLPDGKKVKILPAGETYTVDFSGTDAGCGTWFNLKTVDALLGYTTSKPDGTVVTANGFVKSDWQLCQFGVNIAIIIK